MGRSPTNQIKFSFNLYGNYSESDTKIYFAIRFSFSDFSKLKIAEQYFVWFSCLFIQFSDQ